MFLDPLQYAKVLTEIGELALAEREVSEILEQAPDNLDALSLAAKLKHIRGELTAAVACWAQIHARSPLREPVRTHLMSMLQMARDPERGAGEFIAIGQDRLMRKPAAYLALEGGFHLFVARQPEQARLHCQRVAGRYRGVDREVYKIAVLSDALFSELSGELEQACATLERLGTERNFETDFDRVTALVELYQRIGSRDKLAAAINICRFLEQRFEPLQVLGRLALLYRRIGATELAHQYEHRHLAAFRSGMRVDLAEVLHAGSRRYLPLAQLLRIRLTTTEPPPNATERERALAIALAGDLPEAERSFERLTELLDSKYQAELCALRGDIAGATGRFVALVREDPEDRFVVGWVLDHLADDTSSAIRETLCDDQLAARVRAQLQAAVELEPTNPLLWRRLGALAGLKPDQRALASELFARSTALEDRRALREHAIGRVLSAAVYHFVGKGKGLIHEVWAERQPTAEGKGGALPDALILGNLSRELRTNVLNTFVAARAYARVKFPRLARDILDYNYAFKMTKEDEPSGGLSAGLPTALAFLSVFLQRPVPQDLACSGVLVADAHDVLVVGAVGEADLKVKGAYHRNLRCVLLPEANRQSLSASPLVPPAIVDEIVEFVPDLDSAVRAAFGDEVLLGA